MAKRPIFKRAHEAATNNGRAITSTRVSIIDNPLEIFKLTTLYIIIKRLRLWRRESWNRSFLRWIGSKMVDPSEVGEGLDSKEGGRKEILEFL